MLRCLPIVLALTFVQIAQAQDEFSIAESAWTPIIVHDGLDVRYIFYSQADNVNNGVVLKLSNLLDEPIEYRFTIIFRSATQEAEEVVEGSLKARQVITGDRVGMFFIPFPDGDQIVELGLRGYRVKRGTVH